MKGVPYPHKHFADAAAELKKALENHRPGRLVAICGLSGAGKTTLRNFVLRDLLGDPAKWGKGKLPATEVMALLSLNSKFSAKGFASRAHWSVLRPDLGWLYRDTDEEIQQAYLDSIKKAEAAWGRQRVRPTTAEHEYWNSFIDSAIDRDLRFLLVEHAHAFGKLRAGEEAPDHAQNLMSVMESVGAMAVLNMVPSGYTLWVGRPEIADRMERIYIKPYDLNDQVQVNEYGKMVAHVGSRYRFRSMEVYRNAITEIGIATGTSTRALEELFNRATRLAANAGRESIDDADLLGAIDKAEHVGEVWKQIRLLSEISRPASFSELRALHQAHVTLARQAAK